ncbi:MULTISPECIES: hypothetical protein [unclassified Sphingobium]|uniref:hypothetical protein n=1 Tax=unclassified Sphingobium TaxID=2611147 RepID=UPI002225A791|nr:MULTISPECIES: hypothetical protein [unclassified Sphingobium]MCW2412031.1 hypothetical protein [Sphingobium sp. B8D3D]MCW2415671.1 hypothetical protein [Sphingobium sp. B8D3A]
MKNRSLFPVAAVAVIAIVCLALGIGAYLGAVSAARLVEFKLLDNAGATVVSDAVRNARDLAAQEDMARWALWMLVISSISVLITVCATLAVIEQIRLTSKALKAADKANAISENIGRAQIRCYVTFKSCEVTILANGAVRIALSVHNSGQSPARQLLNEVMLEIWHRGEGWRWHPPQYHSVAGIDLSANAPETLEVQLPDLIPPDDLSDLIHRSELQTRVRCCAIWQDVFSQPEEGEWSFETTCIFPGFEMPILVKRTNVPIQAIRELSSGPAGGGA